PEQSEADPVQLVVVMIAPVHELEEQVDVGEARGPHRHPETPGVAELRAVAGGENVDGQPGERMGDRRGQLEPPLEDLEVALLRLDDVGEERVDGGDLAVLVELVVEGRELRLVLEAEDLHQVVRAAPVLVDRDLESPDPDEQRLELAHEIEELS